MPPFAWFEKSRFSEVWGTLRWGPWGLGEVETIFFSKFLTGLSRRFRRHPTWHLLLRLKKVRFRRSLGTLRRGPWGPGEVEIEIFLEIVNGLEQTLPTMPHLLYLDGKNKFLKILAILRPPRNFPKFLNRPGTPLEWFKLN